MIRKQHFNQVLKFKSSDSVFCIYIFFLYIFKCFPFSDILLKVRQPMDSEVDLLRQGQTLISFLYPGQNKDLIDKLATKKINAFG